MIALLAWCLTSLALAAPSGWRGDGAGHFPGADLAPAWSAEAGVLWSTPLGGPSNASPVVAGDRVCALVEPSDVVCVEAATGKVAWRASLGVVDVLPEADAARLRPLLARVPEAQAELARLQARYAQLRRESRAGGDALAALQETVSAMERAATELAAVDAHLPPPAGDEIGWTSPTPVTDGKRLFVYLANGVVAAFDVTTGKRLWGRWLGKHTARLFGYDGQPTASPLLAGGALVVGYNSLVALDASTGAVRWELAPYNDFGAPAAATVGGVTVVLTPSGRMVRLSDGKVLQEGLANLWYSGPTVQGSRVWFVGTTTDMSAGGWPTHAVCWDLAAAGDGVVATKRWAVQLPVKERFYASPLVWGKRLISVAIDGSVVELDAETGAHVRTVKLEVPLRGQVWASPMVVGSALRIASEKGNLLTLDSAFRIVGDGYVERALQQPAFAGTRAYIRGRTRLWAVGR